LQSAIFAIPLTAIALNGMISAITPVNAFPWDDLFLQDSVWRIVQGQIAGVDFYNPLGFGPFHLAAMLYRLTGPSRFPLSVSVGIISGVVAICAALVISRRPILVSPIGLLLCLTFAFQASSPAVYGWPFFAIGISAFYNRLTVAALSVLALQSFTIMPREDCRVDLVEVLVSAALLNVLFLVKISALGIGFCIILVSSVLRDLSSLRFITRYTLLAVIFLAFLAMDFSISGVSINAVIGLYHRAAEVRASLAGWDALPRLTAGWMAFVGLAILGIQAFASANGGTPCIRLAVILGSYVAFQSFLNISNTQPGTAALAAAFGGSLLAGNREVSSARWFRIGETAARLAILLNLVPDMLGAAFAGGLVMMASIGSLSPTIIGAGKGISLPVLSDFRGGDATTAHANAVNVGLHNLQELDVDRLRIASMDYDNPFPVMLQAPSPVWVDVVLSPGYMERGDVLFDPEEIIGNACIVMSPRSPAPVIAGSADLIAASVASVLKTNFQLLRHGAAWDIFRRVGACPD
jgi:hypothetical protein